MNIVPGSKKAENVKSSLIDEGLWSHYLEGIVPDAEVFSKCQVLALLGTMRMWASISSKWNNPEPELF